MKCNAIFGDKGGGVPPELGTSRPNNAAHRAPNPVRASLSSLAQFLRSARSGAGAGLVVAVLLLPVYAGLCLRTGFGMLADAVCGLLFGASILVVATSAALLGLAILRRIPLCFGALATAVFACLIITGKGFGHPAALSIRLGLWPIFLLALAGAGTSVLLRRGPGRPGRVRAVLGSVMLLAAVGGAGVLVFWLAAPGEDPFLEDAGPMAGGPAVPLEASNPADVGPYQVAFLCYGSGTDRHRPEYGPKVALKTPSVDASSFIELGHSRLGLWARQKYWGFEPNSLPLNARVWYPKDDGRFPLVLIVHGNHQMDEPSDAGYAYLGELLASRGFIVVSVDENFLNRSWFGNLGEENGARSWLLLKHLELWRAWNEQEGNPFCQRVDLSNIALIGHSRGGEAIVHAAAFNRLTHHPGNANVLFRFGFNIKTLIAIAPTDGLYRPRGLSLPVRDLNYLVLQGSHDGDLGGFPGAGTFHRVLFTSDEYRMKAALYIYRANHGQFNTVWGNRDRRPPLRHLLNRGPLLTGEDQRTIASVYVSAFLEATLRGGEEYLPLFRDYRRAAQWLPRTIYFSRFQDSEFHAITDFDRRVEVTETTLPGGTQSGERLG
ncbi:MAG: MFS transporter, partial [Planctomycetes bacterium]|nr:MFS transporter [Planctomycetota bacterium]